jgi:hypothetical protein
MTDQYIGTIEQFEKFYNDTVAETREQIAQEIEAKIMPHDAHTGDGFCVCEANYRFEEAAAIARGN